MFLLLINRIDMFWIITCHVQNQTDDIIKRMLLSISQKQIWNVSKILAEFTFNIPWGTGLNKCITLSTTPKFWLGNNLLGVLLMDLGGADVARPTQERYGFWA